MLSLTYRYLWIYLRSGLAGFEREEIDLLENYVLSHGIKGKSKWMNLFTSGAKENDGVEMLSRLNSIRERLTSQLEPLMMKSNTAGEKIKQLYEFIINNTVQEKLAVYEKMFQAKGDVIRAKEYAQIYRLVMDLLDQIESLLRDEKLSRKEFAEILDAGFGEIEVGTIPQNVDRVVVGDMERTRLKEIKVLFFLGINDGNIPKNTGTGGIISDIDREFLKDSPYALAPTPRQQMYIQRLYLYMNLTKPSEYLYLSYCKVSSEGKSMRPAYLIDTMHQLFPGLVTEKPELYKVEEQLETKKAGLDHYADMLRDYAAGYMEDSEKKKVASFYQVYHNDVAYQEEIDRLTEAAFTSYSPSPLKKEIASLLYGNMLLSSVSRLERYAACSYAHFLQYGLSLQEREEYEFEAIDMGNVFHGVLESFAVELQNKGYSWFDFKEESVDGILKQALDSYAAAYGETILYSTARNEYSIDRMHRILKRTVLTLQHQLKKGMFIPENYELSFAMADNLDAVNITLSQEEKMKLQGRIDRIDTYEDDEHVYVKVIDYKSGSKKFDLAALYYGLQLQLVVYMNAAVEMEQKKNPGKEIIPSALLYYRVTDPMVKADEEITAQEVEERLLRELRMTGVVTENDTIISMLDQEFEDKSDVVPVERKRDGSYSAKSSVISMENLQEVSDYVNVKIKQIGKEIVNGSIAVNPCSQGNMTACDYCAYKSVCGFDPGIQGYRLRELDKLTDQEAIDRMKEEIRQRR